MNTPKLIIGIVGPLASGKGAVAELLMSRYGFVSFTLSHLVHEELYRRGIKEFTRKDLQDVGNDLRQHFGNHVLAQRAVEKLTQNGNQLIIIEGIRNPAEVQYLRKHLHFYLISVSSERLVRFARLMSRAKPWDPKTWKEFLKIDQRDLGKNEAVNGQQVRACIELADFQISNNKDLLYLYNEVDRVIFHIRRKDTFAKKLLPVEK